MPGRTLFTVLEETASKEKDKAALHQPSGARQGGGYRSYSWNEWVTAARETAVGLHLLGMQKGEIVCVLCETRAEFYLVDLGIMAGGGVAAALYTAYPFPELARDVIRSGARFLFIEDPKSLAALQKALQDKNASLPEHTMLITGEAAGTTSLDELRAQARAAMEHDPGLFDRVHDQVSPADPAILYLTSGATGEPKMGLTSHAAAIANADMAPIVLPIGPDDATLVFLPSAHIAQRIVLEFVPMRMGTPVWFSESLARLPHELRTVRPTLFLAPPRVWERMYANIQTELKKRPAAVKRLLYSALGLALSMEKKRQRKEPVPAWATGTLKLADKLFFSKVREKLGGRIRIAASGAAPLARDLADFYAAIGLPSDRGIRPDRSGRSQPESAPRPTCGIGGQATTGRRSKSCGGWRAGGTYTLHVPRLLQRPRGYQVRPERRWLVFDGRHRRSG